jgi:hypothetical protein
MIDYRLHLTSLVAVFMALGLGMLIGGALTSTPPPAAQQEALNTLQQRFAEFSQQYSDLRDQKDDLKERMLREDQGIRLAMEPALSNRLYGRRIAVILCGEVDGAAFLPQLNQTIEDAGGEVVSTTRVGDDWLPLDAEARNRMLVALGVYAPDLSDARAAAVLGRAVANGRAVALQSAARVAGGLRLDGDYSRRVSSVLLITGATDRDRLRAAKAGVTPEQGLLKGLKDAEVRVVAAEPDGEDALTTISFWSGLAPATVDNVDMAAGQLCAVYALAGRDGRYGIKRAAERALPDFTLKAPE